MAKQRVQKEASVKEIAQELGRMKSAVFADLSGLKSNESNSLRRKSQKEEIGIRMTKKTLLHRALKDAGVESVDTSALPGSVFILYGFGDEVAPAKTLAAFAKDHERVGVLGGVLESRWISSEQVKALSKLPSKQELIAKVVGSIQAPISGLVNVLQGNLRNLVGVLNAISKIK
ncbi:50S ribosomal protein L10 [Candidatus Uhrbacteria bacterium]|nr:50S ribosomal protein L10 [Candidatus Uhrbacteria bacterium]